MAKLDPELDTEVAGESEETNEDANEALGARHRRRFGYTAEGAQENDSDILAKGRKPLHVTMHKSHVPESRIANFHHAIEPNAHITTVKKHRI